jgi:thiol:disulfide interchange protein
LHLGKIIGFALLLAIVAALAPAAETIPWIYDIDSGLAAAKRENKPLMIDFTAGWCPPCKEMERLTFGNVSVILRAKSFIPVRIDIDKQRQVAAKYKALARAYGGVGVPNMLFLKSDGTTIKHAVGYYGPEQLLSLMDSILKSSR